MNKTFKIGNKIEINRIGLGTMRLTSGIGKWGNPPDKKNSIKLLREAVKIGINFFDTADMYGPGISENIIKEALYPYDKNIVIATKGGNEIYGPNLVKANCQPENLIKKAHESLKRLKLERIDLYQLHTVDPSVDIEFSIEALAKLREENKIRFIGVSNINMNDFKRALTVTEIHSVQNRFNYLEQSDENIIKFSDKLNIAYISYYPFLKGSIVKENLIPNFNSKDISQANQLLLWQLNYSKNIITIPGTTCITHLLENFSTLNYL